MGKENTEEALFEFWEEKGAELHLGEKELEKLSNCFMIASEADMKQFIVSTGNKIYSVKPGNVLIDSKKALRLAADLFLGSSLPESFLGMIKLFLMSILLLCKAAIAELPGHSDLVVGALSQKLGYKIWCGEEEAYRYIEKFCEENQFDVISEEDFKRTLTKLDQMKVVSISEGKIMLKEHILIEIA